MSFLEVSIVSFYHVTLFSAFLLYLFMCHCFTQNLEAWDKPQGPVFSIRPLLSEPVSTTQWKIIIFVKRRSEEFTVGSFPLSCRTSMRKSAVFRLDIKLGLSQNFRFGEEYFGEKMHWLGQWFLLREITSPYRFFDNIWGNLWLSQQERETNVIVT